MHPYKLLTAAAVVLSALEAHGATLTSSADGYTIVALGSYASVRCYGICSAGQGQRMAVSTTTTPTQSTTTGGGTQAFTTGSGPSGPSPDYQVASVSAYASANYGAVHVRAANGAAAAPISVLDPDGVRNLPSPYTAIAQVSAYASFADTLHVTSGNLAVGTPVSFTLNFYLEGTLHTQQNSDTTQTMGYTVFDLNPIGSGYSGYTTCGTGGFLTCDPNFSLPVQTKVGDSIPISTTITVGGTAFVDAAYSAANPSFNNFSRSGSADFSNTAGQWVSQVSPGVQITSESGFDYTVKPAIGAVPLPASAVLMLFGLPLLGRSRKGGR